MKLTYALSCATAREHIELCRVGPSLGKSRPISQEEKSEDVRTCVRTLLVLLIDRGLYAVSCLWIMWQVLLYMSVVLVS